VDSARSQAEVIPGADWLHDSNAREWQVLARRKPATGIAQATAELEVLARTWPSVTGRPAHLVARPATFFQADSGEFETFVQVCWVLMIAVGLILMIGAINLVNLLFARNAAGEREFAVRLSLGARRIDLIRQLSTESAVVGLAGGGAGLLLSLWVCEWIRERIGAFL
jgi:predicted lysophospholipase L1 biosynthesis ABC-type transport system permease subunit